MMKTTRRGNAWRGGVALAILTSALAAHGERINQEGRILGPAPVVSAPVLFNTPEADVIVSALQIFPVTSAWNENISRRPTLANSDGMIAQIKADLSATRQTLRPFYEMNYVLVPDVEARATIAFLDYPDESDLDGGVYPNGRYPIPANMPIETWPRGTATLTLQEWQADVNNSGGDRHGIIVAPGGGSIWETWQMKLVSGNWQASNGAMFNLNSNTSRPAGWTSGDAAGLPLFPAVVRYDECQRGMVEHALRLCVPKTRREYIYPATHFASSIPSTSTNYAAMGQRLRLKSSFVVPAGWTLEEKSVALALKKYGAIVADNSGGFFSVSVCPDDRFASNAFDNLSTIDVGSFEVVSTTGATEGPRSPGAPTVDAGPDQVVSSLSATLSGSVVSPSAPATLYWQLYAGPASVLITNPSSSYATVTFTREGSYTFMFSADDATHAVAYDAVVVSVTSGPSPSPTPSVSPTPATSPTPTPTATPMPTSSPTPNASPTPTATPSPIPTSTPTVRISVSPGQISEGADAMFTISSSSVAAQPLTIQCAMRGTAQSGSDYALSVSGAVTIPAGQSSATVLLHANTDAIKEKNETAIMALVPAAGYKLPSRAKATLTIVDGP